MTITRIIASATIASALAFAPAAFAEGSHAHQGTHEGRMHDSRPDADCGCPHARSGHDETRASRHDPVPNDDRGQGHSASEAGGSWSSRNR
jgi:hypothetical protein